MLRRRPGTKEPMTLRRADVTKKWVKAIIDGVETRTEKNNRCEECRNGLEFACAAIRRSFPDGLVTLSRLAHAAGCSAATIKRRVETRGGSLELCIETAPEGWETESAVARRHGVRKPIVREVLEEIHAAAIAGFEGDPGIQTQRWYVHPTKGSVEMHYPPDVVKRADEALNTFREGRSASEIASEAGVSKRSAGLRAERFKDPSDPCGGLRALRTRRKQRVPRNVADALTTDFAALKDVPNAPEGWKTARGWTKEAVSQGLNNTRFASIAQAVISELAAETGMGPEAITAILAGPYQEPRSIRVFVYYSPAVAEMVVARVTQSHVPGE